MLYNFFVLSFIFLFVNNGFSAKLRINDEDFSKDTLVISTFPQKKPRLTIENPIIYPKPAIYHYEGGNMLSSIADLQNQNELQEKPILALFMLSFCTLIAIPSGYLALYGGVDPYIFYAMLGTLVYICTTIVGAIAAQFLNQIIVIGIIISTVYISFIKWRNSPFADLVYIFMLSVGLLISNLIYNLIAALPFKFNPNYTGLAGMIVNTGLLGDHFIFIHVIHWIVLSLMSLIIVFLIIPPSVRSTDLPPSTESELKYIKRWTSGISTLVLTYPIVAAISIILGYIYGTRSPLDPISFFHIPTELRYNSFESILIILWFTLAYLSYRGRNYIEVHPELRPGNMFEYLANAWTKFRS